MSKILKSERDVRSTRRYSWSDNVITLPGLLLTMLSGEQWFHPYDGSNPWKITT